MTTPEPTVPSRGPRSLLFRLVRALLLAPVALLLLTVLQVLTVRFVTPPLTLTMAEVRWETGALDYRPLPMSAMGPHLPRVAIAAEDGPFHHHHGFDFAAIAAALKGNEAGGKVRGASTITQQVAKNAFLWQDRTWLRKGLEAWYTVLLELLLPKDRILELYLNLAQTGPTQFGMEAGARHWFGAPASALTLEQAARLASILPSPAKWSPRSDSAGERAAAILDHRVPFPGEPGFDAVGRSVEDRVHPKALWE